MRLSPLAGTHRCERDSFIQVRAVVGLGLLCVSVRAVVAAPVPAGKPGNYPAWWFARGVIAQSDTNSPPSWPTDYPTSDDYAGVNQGQLKNFAAQAYNELQAQSATNIWPSSYGTNLTTMITSWNPTNGDAYAAVNIGQLKSVAAPFYNLLIHFGFTNNYPWNGSGADDYAGANIGQMKQVFSFVPAPDGDGNGLPDWWEILYFGHVGNVASSSPDGSPYTLAQDYAGGANPTNYYSWPGPGTNGPVTVVPAIAIVSGNNQTNSPGEYTAQPLVVKVANSSGGAPLTNAPVTFSVTSGGGLLTTGSAPQTNVAVGAGTNGYAQVYYQQPLTNNINSTITASTGGQSATFTEWTTVGDGTFDSPSNMLIVYGGVGVLNLTWSNHATSATGILIEQTADYGNTWTTAATLSDPTATSYSVTGLTEGVVYGFRISATK